MDFQLNKNWQWVIYQCDIFNIGSKKIVTRNRFFFEVDIFVF